MVEMITFRDYVRYLELEIESEQTHLFSGKKKEQYSAMKAELMQALKLPRYMLDTPLLAAQQSFDEETIKAISDIKRKIALGNKQKMNIALIIQSLNEKISLVITDISTFILRNMFVLASASVGLIVLWGISSLLAPIQMIAPIGSSLVGAAGFEEQIEITVVEGSYITNAGELTFIIGAILLLVGIFIYRKK